MKKREAGGAGTMLLILVLAAAAVYLVLHFLVLNKQSDSGTTEEVEGVKVERNIRSVDRANQVIQDTKNTLRDQEKAMQERMKRNLNPQQ